MKWLNNYLINKNMNNKIIITDITDTNRKGIDWKIWDFIKYWDDYWMIDWISHDWEYHICWTWHSSKYLQCPTEKEIEKYFK